MIAATAMTPALTKAWLIRRPDSWIVTGRAGGVGGDRCAPRRQSARAPRCRAHRPSETPRSAPGRPARPSRRADRRAASASVTGCACNSPASMRELRQQPGDQALIERRRRSPDPGRSPPADAAASRAAGLSGAPALASASRQSRIAASASSSLGGGKVADRGQRRAEQQRQIADRVELGLLVVGDVGRHGDRARHLGQFAPAAPPISPAALSDGARICAL